MTIRLRPHHLLCLLTYVGKGYSPAFTANYDVIAERLGRGEDIEIVAGPDDICAPLLDEPAPHCQRDSVIERDRLAARDVGVLLAKTLHAGDRLALDTNTLMQMRAEFSSGRTRQACNGCEWANLCTAIAGNGYLESLVQLPASSRTPADTD